MNHEVKLVAAFLTLNAGVIALAIAGYFDVKSTIEPWQHGWHRIQRQSSALESITINRDHWRVTQQ